MSSRLRPIEASATGLTCTRTADFAPPPMITWLTPSDLADALADDLVGEIVNLRERLACRRSSPSTMIGESDGLILR